MHTRASGAAPWNGPRPVQPAALSFVRQVTGAAMFKGLGDQDPREFDAGGWHLAHWYGSLGEAKHCRRCAGLGVRISASNAASAASFVRTASSARSINDQARLDGAPATFQSAAVNARGYPDVHFTLQFYVEDCTGCGLCVEACPAKSPVEPGIRAINMTPKAPLVDPSARQYRVLRAPSNQRSRAR